MTTLTLEEARGVLQAQPFSMMLGTVLTRFDESGITLELDVNAQLLQQHGYVHGGVLCYLADNAITFAGGLTLGPDVLTSGVALTYLRPAQGERLIARARTQGSTSRTAATQVEIHVQNAEGEYLCAVGSGTVTARTR
ncbi:PaaI family thioesterase [Microbacterium sp. H1-D42]|uniref:PaaI family thioesterase n=1 Tax=Microbacterium sp. H1-D42 TaxID=2925844 RepID=UPI001F537D0C|nr:PaaI family thioesterase [Microbacterium sp. H1-D42]UNK69846.1 PaaI family thioesterase [Microbacterium sp. H1-D42]